MRVVLGRYNCVNENGFNTKVTMSDLIDLISKARVFSNEILVELRDPNMSNDINNWMERYTKIDETRVVGCLFDFDVGRLPDDSLLVSATFKHIKPKSKSLLVDDGLYNKFEKDWLEGSLKFGLRGISRLVKEDESITHELLEVITWDVITK